MFKFQTKIPSRSGVCVQGEWQKYTPPSPPLSKDEGLKDIGHSISIANLILGLSNVMIWFLICWFLICYGLIFDATGFIIKRDSYFITKGDRSLLQNASGFLLQNATIFLEKKVITNCDNFITKYDSYYKMWRLLQIATVHCFTNDVSLALFFNFFRQKNMENAQNKRPLMEKLYVTVIASSAKLSHKFLSF